MSYLITAKRVEATLFETIREAVSTLPAEVKTKHWLAAKTSPSPWKVVEAWYPTTENVQEDVWDVITNIALLADALANVLAVTATPLLGNDGHVFDLKLKKTKRVEL